MKPVILKDVSLASVTFAAIVLSGCTYRADSQDELTAEAKSALTSENSLVTNAIDLNGLISNAIDLNGIDPVLVSADVLAALQDNGLLGSNTRMLYKYLVGCALDPNQSISFSWTDTQNVVHQEEFFGEIGLASSWKNSAINKPGRRSVSACMGARANYFGTHVMISLRGPQASIKQVSSSEQQAYPLEEGAFWGDLFDGTPQLYACRNSTNVANSRSKFRDCAAGYPVDGGGYLECSHITIVGDCDSLCAALDSSNFYRPRCDDDELGAGTNDVVTVFLPQ